MSASPATTVNVAACRTPPELARVTLASDARPPPCRSNRSGRAAARSERWLPATSADAARVWPGGGDASPLGEPAADGCADGSAPGPSGSHCSGGSADALTAPNPST